MPNYDFINDKTGEIKTLFFGMNEEKVFVDKSGLQWRRIYYSPQAAVSARLDPFSSKQFVEKTGSSKGTMNDLWERSKEMSLKREQIVGKDEVKENYYDNYSVKRGNKVEHPDRKNKRLQEDFSKMGVHVEI